MPTDERGILRRERESIVEFNTFTYTLINWRIYYYFYGRRNIGEEHRQGIVAVGEGQMVETGRKGGNIGPFPPK